MKLTAKYPAEPGCYFIFEVGSEPFMVRVEIESDSHRLFYALIPGDDYKYPLEMWKGALWYGPISGDH